MRAKLDAWVEAHAQEILAETRAILQIPSVKERETVEPGAPFGKPVAEALRHTLALCSRLGMQTEGFDGYAGHAEFGGGAEIVGMLGHLDVVPAGDGWTHDPWAADVADGFLWGRGTSDDKGPTYAALFGAKAVLDVCAAEGVTLSRRIRLIFGCDEESGWECMAHYFGAAGQAKPTVAFTPDAYFPLVYAEKGSFTGVAERPVTPSPEGDGAGALRIATLRSGLRPNMVPADAAATLTGPADLLDSAAHALEAMPGIAAVSRLRGELLVTAEGKSAHGSTPEQGVNAAVLLLRALSGVPGLAAEDADWTADLAGRADTAGAGVGIAGQDDVTGPLTSNLGVVEYVDGTVRAAFNVRYPATWESDDVTGRFRASLARTGWSVPPFKVTPPLYVPQDQEPVRTLLSVYREQTGDTETAPLTIGGRTYATTVAPVGVAFGAAMPGDPDVAHQADERFAVERLIQCAKIYAHALYELAK